MKTICADYHDRIWRTGGAARQHQDVVVTGDFAREFAGPAPELSLPHLGNEAID